MFFPGKAWQKMRPLACLHSRLMKVETRPHWGTWGRSSRAEALGRTGFSLCINFSWDVFWSYFRFEGTETKRRTEVLRLRKTAKDWRRYRYYRLLNFWIKHGLFPFRWWHSFRRWTINWTPWPRWLMRMNFFPIGQLLMMINFSSRPCCW